MDNQRIPKPGEIYKHFKDRLYQVVAIAEHSETGEQMVVYQALYDDFKTYVRPLNLFIAEVDKGKYPEVKQKYRFEPIRTQYGDIADVEVLKINTKLETVTPVSKEEKAENTPAEESIAIEPQTVNSLLLDFLDAESFNKKLEILTSNIKHMNDRLINDMAAALDCTVDEGPLDQRIQGLIFCLQAMCRFEDRRLR